MCNTVTLKREGHIVSHQGKMQLGIRVLEAIASFGSLVEGRECSAFQYNLCPRPHPFVLPIRDNRNFLPCLIYFGLYLQSSPLVPHVLAI